MPQCYASLEVIRFQACEVFMPNRKVICTGRAPLPGCRATLTVTERRHFESHCEHCEMAFQDRWRAWCLGDHDPEMDELFGDGQRPKERANAQRQDIRLERELEKT